MLRSFETARLMRAPRVGTYSVLTDFAGFEDWIPGVTRSRTLIREGGIAIVELAVPAFTGAEFLFECVENGSDELRFRELNRGRNRGLNGKVTIVEEESGRASLVHLRCTLNSPWYAFGAGRRLRGFARRVMADLGAQIARRGADGGRANRRHRLLEIRSQGEGFEVFVADRLVTRLTNSARGEGR